MSTLFDSTTCSRIIDFYACISQNEQLDYALHWKRCEYISENDSLVDSDWSIATAVSVNEGYTASESWIVVDVSAAAVDDVITLTNTIQTVNGVTAIARIHLTVE